MTLIFIGILQMSEKQLHFLRLYMDRILNAVKNNFEGEEILRQTIVNRTPFFGNDDDYADDIALKVYDDLIKAIDG